MKKVASVKVTRNMRRMAMRSIKKSDIDEAARVISRAYLSDVLSWIDGAAYGFDLSTDKERIEFVLWCFSKEFWNKYEAHRLRIRSGQTHWEGNVARGLKSWMQGLPSVITARFSNFDILEDAKAKGFDVPELWDYDFIDAVWGAYGYALVLAARRLGVSLPSAKD